MKSKILILMIIGGLIVQPFFMHPARAGNRVQIRVCCRYEPKMQMSTAEEKPAEVIKPSNEQIFVEKVKSKKIVQKQEINGGDKPRYEDFERVTLYTIYAY